MSRKTSKNLDKIKWYQKPNTIIFSWNTRQVLWWPTRWWNCQFQVNRTPGKWALHSPKEIIQWMWLFPIKRGPVEEEPLIGHFIFRVERPHRKMTSLLRFSFVVDNLHCLLSSYYCVWRNHIKTIRTIHIKLWGELSTSILCGKYKNLIVCGKST